MKLHHLYIDELGSPNPKSPAHDFFVVSACCMPDTQREVAKTHAEHIRFKYWGGQNHDLIFHSMDIGRRSGAFGIFKDKDELYEEFLRDLLDFLKAYQIKVFVNLTDHAVAQQRNWDTNAVLSKASNHIVESFIRYLVGCKSQGKIIIESATDAQNLFFLRAFTTYLAPKAVNGIDFKTIQKALTSLSIVTKNNNDIEEQIADLFAFAARCKYERDKKAKTFASASYEYRIIKILENKLYSVPATTSPVKRRILGRIESFKILTK